MAVMGFFHKKVFREKVFREKKRVPDHPLAKEVSELLRLEAEAEAYRLLGKRYLWYEKIRTAKRYPFSFFKKKTLEAEMAASRSALALLTRTLHAGVTSAFNTTIEDIAKRDTQRTDLPPPLSSTAQQRFPQPSDEEDAWIITHMPLRFLNQSRILREKGKGIDDYTEDLIKKMYFKVVGFYGNPAHWRVERLGYFLLDLPADASVEMFNRRLSPLKTELELFAAHWRLFPFTSSPRHAKGTTKHTMDNMIFASPSEQLNDLYMQSLIVNGMAQFMFRYYLTLLSIIPNPAGMPLLSHCFQNALAKVEAVCLQFRASFWLERDKIRIRPHYRDYVKYQEARPLRTSLVKKMLPLPKYNYSHKLLRQTAFPYGTPMEAQQIRLWQDYLRGRVLQRKDKTLASALMVEISHTFFMHIQHSCTARREIIGEFHRFGETLQKQGKMIFAQKQEKLEQARRNLQNDGAGFQGLKKGARTPQEDFAALEVKTRAEIKWIEQGLAESSIHLSQRITALEKQVQADSGERLGYAFADILSLALNMDEGQNLLPHIARYLIATIPENPYLNRRLDYYKHLLAILPGFSPLEKVGLRQALASRVELSDEEMVIPPEDVRAHQRRIAKQEKELERQSPGLLQRRLRQGLVDTTVGKLLNIALTPASLKLVLSLPVDVPNKQSEKLPPSIVDELQTLNRLYSPFLHNDVLLTDVNPEQPLNRRINLNRLHKLLTQQP